MPTVFDQETWDRLHQQLAIGKNGEIEIAQDLTDIGYTVYQTEGKHNFDLSAITKTQRLVKIEIKTDLISHKTGNVGIEYQQNGKPSGISTTESDIWVWYINGNKEILYFDTAVVKGFVTDELYHDKKETVNSCYYLIRVDKIRPFAKLIRNI